MFAWLRRKPAPPSEEKLRVIEALVDYPVYAPPIRRSKAQSLKEAHDAYTTYFFENRSERVAALRKFLAKFDVTLSLDDANVKAVSAWCPVYADLLVDGLQHQESDELWCAYNWFEVPWTGAMIGFNPIFDLGVFMGECILSRNPRLKWRPLVNPEPGKGASHIIYSSSGRPNNQNELERNKALGIYAGAANACSGQEGSFDGSFLIQTIDRTKKYTRLSVLPSTAEEWKLVCKMGGL